MIRSGRYGGMYKKSRRLEEGKAGMRRSYVGFVTVILLGATRVKTHLLKTSCGVNSCPKVTVDILVQLKGEQDRADATIASASNMPCNIPLPNDDSGSGRKRKASAIEASFDVDTRSKQDALIARMFYTAGVPFNLARNPWFRQAFMFAANNKLGGYVPPSYNKIRTNLLAQEKTHVEGLLQPIKSTWSSKGVSIVSDGWADPQRRSLLNFMAITEDGPMFLRAINGEKETKSKEYIFQKMLETIDFIGAANVVQVITDNASNCRAVGLLVEQKYPHIFWTPCVVHTLNLALKSICAPRSEEDLEYEHCNWISEVTSDVQQIRNYIMNHSMRLTMFNDSSNLKLLAIAETRFASQIVMLKRFRDIKESLTLLVVSPRWSDYRDDNQGRAQFVKEKILSDLWWDKVKYILDFCEPIYSMIRAADTDKPCLHLIYEMWDSMIEKVRTYLEPKIWWGIHGNSAPDLQKMALKLLGQPSSSSCAERNWSTYGLIHSTSRNRLNPGRAEDLVFVHQNLRLISRKSAEYSSGPTRYWDIGGDTHEIFGGGGDFLQEVVLSLDEPDVEAMLDDIERLENEA